MPAPVQRLAPKWSRVVIAFVGAFAAAVIPVSIPLALGISVSDDAVGMVVAGVLIYCVCFMVGIFWSGQWAARIEPPADRPPQSFEQMRRRLLALNDLDLPFGVHEVQPGHFHVDWDVDVVRTHRTDTGGVTTSSRLVVRLVEAAHQARAVEVTTRMAWNDDAQNYQWHGAFTAFRGISLASYTVGPHNGVSFRDGAWSVVAGHRWAYSIDELKQPLVQAVVLSGWTWQPVVFR